MKQMKHIVSDVFGDVIFHFYHTGERLSMSHPGCFLGILISCLTKLNPRITGFRCFVPKPMPNKQLAGASVFVHGPHLVFTYLHLPEISIITVRESLCVLCEVLGVF